jgi:hypothetical protein
MIATTSLLSSNNERQWSVNNLWSYILDNQTALKRQSPIIKVLATFMGTNASDDIATTF